ncbi:hypothetical protein F5X68DRAFT_254489 [Plectosphaerella plurivora]|uniref:NB-ARC domain-containing protein n=1 Tax=Plectosphaerella plurivora TaxID=936078 RepID=A0A9P9AA39_9PEZI|nr:hypothetical protein F5X68DRAFT_254489 [Plectosphaerella plurivora]
MNIIDIRPQDLGVKVLHDPKEVDEVEVDVVAVHGIGVHPLKTWTHSKTKTNWLSDPSMLPSALPTSRILSFGYDSVWFGEKSSKQTLDGVATKLLRGLRVERENCPHRPIVFIGHCFGGLVLQKAFMMASSNEIDYPDIFRSTRGMIFIGTPFRGIPESSQLKTSSAIYDAIAAMRVDYQDNILRTIAQDNELLNATVAEFARKISTTPRSPMLFCFFEQRPTNIGAIAGLKTNKEFVATEGSATLDGHEKEGLASDHFQMNKFEDNEDGNYKCVKVQIEKMVNMAKSTVDEVNTQLPQPQHSDRRVDVPFAPDLARKRIYFANRGGILHSIEERFARRTRVALFGDEGAGKTHIAVEYARHYLTETPSARVFWVNAGSPAELMLSYKRIAAELSLPKDDEAASQTVARVRDHLALDFQVQWLLVLDGLDNIDEMQSLNPDVNCNLSFLFPDSDDTENRRILVTTRREDLAVEVVKGKKKYTLPVGTLKKEDISQILYGKITKEAKRQTWADDVAACLHEGKGSAGALDLVRMHFKLHKEAKRSEYIGFLRSAITSGINPVDASWARLFDLINHDHEKEANLWLTFGVLDVEMIPRTFFSKHERSELLPVLINIGVVDQLLPDRSSYRVPKFSRACAQRWLEGRPAKRPPIENMVLQQVLAAWKWEKLCPVLPLALAVSRFQPTSTTGRQALETIRARLSKKKEVDEANKALRPSLAVNAAENGPPATRSRMTSSLKELASGQEPERGPSVRQKSIEGGKKQLRLEGPRVSSSSPALTSRDSPIRTMQQQSRRLEKLQTRDPGWEEPQTWRAAYDLARMRLTRTQHKPDNFKETVNLFEEILKRKSARAGPPSQLVPSQYNLALAHESEGNLDEAVAMGHFALENAALGKSQQERELYFRIKGSLAAWYAARNRHDEALRVFEELLPAMDREIGADHRLTLEARRNKAMFLADLGELESAEAELVAVLRAQELVLGPDDRDCLRTSCQIASVWARLGRKEEAEERFRWVLEKQEEILGADHGDVVMTRRLLGDLFVVEESDS